jgi:phage terminase small subunit
MAKDLNEKQRTFCQLVAKGEAPYKACIEAGYSEQYAKVYSHKLLEKYKNEIEELKQEVKETLEEEFNYSVRDSFNNLCKAQEIALNSYDKNGNPNINAYIKAEELKGKMFGVYEKDNEQRATSYEININRKPVEKDN